MSCYIVGTKIFVIRAKNITLTLYISNPTLNYHSVRNVTKLYNIYNMIIIIGKCMAYLSLFKFVPVCFGSV